MTSWLPRSSLTLTQAKNTAAVSLQNLKMQGIKNQLIFLGTECKMVDVAKLVSINIRDRAIISETRRFERYADVDIDDQIDPKSAEIIRLLKSSMKGERALGMNLLVKNVVDATIHQFLFEIHDNSNFGAELDERAKISGGLYGEIFGNNGWFSSFSKFGE